MTDEPKRKSIDTTKKKSRNRNALVHGLYAKDVLFPWDNPEDFERLHEDLKVEFFPHGRAEEEAVLDLTFLHWDKRTIRRMRQSVVLNDPFTLDIVSTQRKSWSGIRKQLRAAAKDARSLYNLSEEQVSMFQSEMKRLQREMKESTDRDEIKVLESKIAACRHLMSEFLTPPLQTSRGPMPSRPSTTCTHLKAWKKSCGWKRQWMPVSPRSWDG